MVLRALFAMCGMCLLAVAHEDHPIPTVLTRRDMKTGQIVDTRTDFQHPAVFDKGGLRTRRALLATRAAFAMRAVVTADSGVTATVTLAWEGVAQPGGCVAI